MKKLVTPMKVDTHDERADILTKAMSKGTDDYVTLRNDILNIH